jgi:hypothetical protein
MQLSSREPPGYRQGQGRGKVRQGMWKEAEEQEDQETITPRAILSMLQKYDMLCWTIVWAYVHCTKPRDNWTRIFSLIRTHYATLIILPSIPFSFPLHWHCVCFRLPGVTRSIAFGRNYAYSNLDRVCARNSITSPEPRYSSHPHPPIHIPV